MRALTALVVASVLGLAHSAPLSAQTTTAFKTGEATTGMTKQCFYNALGSDYTLTVRAIDLCPLSTQVRTAPTRRPTSPSPSPAPSIPSSITAFKTGERTSGMTKQCYYDGLGSTYTRTVQSFELCPLSIRVQR